jgi:16S rRNA (cytosine1402-N4)-methyltransferase
MNQTANTTAAELLNTLPEAELAQIIYKYGEEPYSRQIAAQIVRRRQEQPLVTVQDLLDCVAQVYQRRATKLHHHWATRTFQALRIAVNSELELLPQALTDMIELLKPNGRMAVITFHSLEDRIVKHHFALAAKDCICSPDVPICVCDHRATIKLLTKRPIQPSAAEIQANPRSRSAKLRVIQKL